MLLLSAGTSSFFWNVSLMLVLVKVNCSCLISAMSHCLIQHRKMVSLFDILPQKKTAATSTTSTDNSNIKSSQMTHQYYVRCNKRHLMLNICLTNLFSCDDPALRNWQNESTNRETSMVLLTNSLSIKSNWLQHDRCSRMEEWVE